MRLFLLVMGLLAACDLWAGEFLDPTIEAESPGAIDPTGFFVLCDEGKKSGRFALSLEDFYGADLSETSKVYHFEVSDKHEEKHIECRVGQRIISSTFEISPPSENGECAAVAQLEVIVKVDGHVILNAPFATYCHDWGGISSFYTLGDNFNNPASRVALCLYHAGYDKGAVANSYSGSYICSDYYLEYLLTENVSLTKDPRVLSEALHHHKRTPNPSLQADGPVGPRPELKR